MIKKGSKDNLKWYPVYTNPRAEKKAYQALLDKGIETYLPLRRLLRQWSDRKKWVEEPLIPSYLFVFVREQELKDVLMTKGIARFIYFSGKIAAMPERQINELKLLMASPFELQITSENLFPGETVLIKAGPLKGLKGEVIAYRSQKLLALRLGEIGFSIVVHIPSALIDRF